MIGAGLGLLLATFIGAGVVMQRAPSAPTPQAPPGLIHADEHLITVDLVARWTAAFKDQSESNATRFACRDSAFAWAETWAAREPGPWLERRGTSWVAVTNFLALLAASPGWCDDAQQRSALRLGRVCLDRTSGDLGGGEGYTWLLVNLADLHDARGEAELIEEIVTDQQADRLRQQRPSNAAWPFIALLQAKILQGNYGDASRLLHDARELAGRAPKLNAVVATLDVLVELERGRLDWAGMALRRLRKLASTGNNASVSPRPAPPG